MKNDEIPAPDKGERSEGIWNLRICREFERGAAPRLDQ